MSDYQQDRSKAEAFDRILSKVMEIDPSILDEYPSPTESVLAWMDRALNYHEALAQICNVGRNPTAERALGLADTSSVEQT